MVQPMFDHTGMTFDQLKSTLPLDKKSFQKTSKLETKLALINFALNNFQDHEYDIFQTELNYPFPFSLSQKFQTRKFATKFTYPYRYIYLLENYLDDDWYFKFVGASDFQELIIFSEKEFQATKDQHTKQSLDLLDKEKKYTDSLTILKEDKNIISGIVYLTSNQGSFFGPGGFMYHRYSCLSKEKIEYAFLEGISGTWFADGVYEISGRKRDFYGGVGLEIEYAKLIEKDLDGPMAKHSKLFRPSEHYAKNQIKVQIKLFKEKIRNYFRQTTTNIWTLLWAGITLLIGLGLLYSIFLALTAIHDFLIHLKIF